MSLKSTVRGIAVWCGAARVTRGEFSCDTDHGMLLEFPDTRSLQEAMNTGRAEFNMPDDTVALALDGSKKQKE